jgi:hypothetical protein
VFRVQTPDWAVLRTFPKFFENCVQGKKTSKKVQKSKTLDFRLVGKPLKWGFQIGVFYEKSFFHPFPPAPAPQGSGICGGLATPRSAPVRNSPGKFQRVSKFSVSQDPPKDFR